MAQHQDGAEASVEQMYVEAPRPGDCVVFKRPDGRFDVQIVVNFLVETDAQSPIGAFQKACEVALERALGRRVWFRQHDEPWNIWRENP